jgi:hypothetical protein
VTYQFDVKRFDAVNRPVNYAAQAAYNEAAQIRRTGFIAQEVEKAADASGYKFSGIVTPKTAKEHYSLSYESFVVPLVKGMQEQQQLIDKQEQKIKILEALIMQQQEQFKKLEEQLKGK